MAEDLPDIPAAISELQALLLGTDSIDEFLSELAALAARTLGGGLSCGITLRPDGQPLTVASSGPPAPEVDDVQYKLGQGPCLDALRTGRECRADDLDGDRRWPAYAPQAVSHGVRSSLSLPLTAQDQTAGAINFYARTPHFFADAQTGQARHFADNAGVAVGLAARIASHAVLTDQLRAALASRSVIDQAIGIIMAEQRCSSRDAFATLRDASQNRNIKLRQLAEDIVTGITGDPPEPPPFHPPR